MWWFITTFRGGSAHSSAHSSFILNRWLAFFSNRANTTFLGHVEQRMLYFFIIIITSLLLYHCWIWLKEDLKKKIARQCGTGHDGRGNQVTEKSVVGIVLNLKTCGSWSCRTHLWKEWIRSFSEAVLIFLGPTGLRASRTVSFLGAVWVPVTHD